MSVPKYAPMVMRRQAKETIWLWTDGEVIGKVVAMDESHVTVRIPIRHVEITPGPSAELEPVGEERAA